MVFYVYEAWDKERDICIYNGSSKKAMYDELYDYIVYQNHIDESFLEDYDSIRDVEDNVLREYGLKIYQNIV